MQWSLRKLILIALAFVAVGVLVFFVASRRELAPGPNDSGGNASSTAGEWKTYRSEKYGVQFSYPPDAVVSEQGTYIFNPRGMGMLFEVEKRGNASVVIRIMPSIENPLNQELEEWVNQKTGGSYDRVEKIALKIGASDVFLATSNRSPQALGYQDYFFVANEKIRFASFSLTDGYSVALRDKFLDGLRFLF